MFFIRDRHIPTNPGLEPILLDLEKLCLLSDEESSSEQSEKHRNLKIKEQIKVTTFYIFGILDMSSWLYIQFFTRNPNLRSKNAKFASQEAKSTKTLPYQDLRV